MKDNNLVIREKENGKLEKINSKYILKIVFDNFEKKKLLDIIKYNKKMKKRINININHYKKYSQKYTHIQIEIKLVNNDYGKFINIKAEEEIYYHIYFDNNKEEIKRYNISKNENVNIIKIKIDYQVKSFKNLFSCCKCIESINFKEFYRNNINNMSFMFSRCSSLKELNLNNFITNNVKDMKHMLSWCSSLKELNLNNFNTNIVKDMSYMFSECSSLKELNINNFNTNNVKDMECMFYKCSSLKELNLNNFNTKNVDYMGGMFSGCSNELIMKIKTQYKNIRGQAF